MIKLDLELNWQNKESISNVLNNYEYILRKINNIDVEYVNSGKTKYVYKISGLNFKNIESKVIAVAVPKESHYDLFSEFEKLKLMHKHFGNKFTPTPEFYIETKDAKMIGMEYLNHDFISQFIYKKDFDDQTLNLLAYKFGQAVGKIYDELKMFHSEPDDYNILVDYKDHTPQIKFLDVFHFKKGSLKDLFDTYLKDYILSRPEIAKSPHQFVTGVGTAIYKDELSPEDKAVFFKYLRGNFT